MAPSPLPLPEAWGHFPDSHCGNMVEFLEVNLTVLWGSPVTGSPGVLTLRHIHPEPPTVHQFMFSYPPHWFPWTFCLWISARCLPVCLSHLGAVDFPCMLPSLTDPGEAVRVPAVRLSVVRLEWQLPGSLPAEPEASQHIFYKEIKHFNSQHF